ncbi:MAG: hypothetical protein OMM_07207 [Candidatus Magnetoglobus multicellularis str. Araruama]|uniref:Uncharacterized protein n=1 Tax=Candidatus Magnetoglobus multicellularis str. Araruama TaxID=890399 RepID=A0A1V1PDW3_9BACT|nr:MAG: hypothetical protein OMM_07207 [Candidatus Magnetoglobus multicellularis str. Araruama]
MTETQIPGLKILEDAFEYWIDSAQRSILFWDVIRKRGNTYLEHLHKGQPPVLIFDYEVLIDGRTLKRPVNYSLSRILPREGQTTDPKKRPIVVIDPRAGHGPGIGGTKEDSEIGLALRDSHPVYLFFSIQIQFPGRRLQMLKMLKFIILKR